MRIMIICKNTEDLIEKVVKSVGKDNVDRIYKNGNRKGVVRCKNGTEYNIFEIFNDNMRGYRADLVICDWSILIPEEELCCLKNCTKLGLVYMNFDREPIPNTLNIKGIWKLYLINSKDEVYFKEIVSGGMLELVGRTKMHFNRYLRDEKNKRPILTKVVTNKDVVMITVSDADVPEVNIKSKSVKE